MTVALHPEDVRAAIRKKFGTLSEFERVNSLPVQSVKDLLRGRTSERTANIIAEELGLTKLILLPATRRGRSAPKRNNKAPFRDCHRLNEVAK